MNTVQLRMKALLDLKVPSLIKIDDQTAVMRINSEWDVKIVILEKSIIYEARSKGKSYNPKKDIGVPQDIIGIIDALDEKYKAALIALLDGPADDLVSEKTETPAEDPLDNLKAGGFEFPQESPKVPEEVPQGGNDSTKKETPQEHVEESKKPEEVRTLEDKITETELKERAGVNRQPSSKYQPRASSTSREYPKREQWKAPSRPAKEEIIDAEFVEIDTKDLPVLPAPVGLSGIVRPAVSAKEALAAWREFQELKKYIIEPSDIQTITTIDKKTGREKQSRFVKKSGWRKFAQFYNLTDRIVEESKEPAGQGGFRWKIKVVCTAPNGRETEGVGMCSSTERGFAHPDHDVYATAHTRAKNRATSDMIAAGEVSAEEIADGGFV